MNTDDINLAYKIRHALNESLDQLPASTTDRLAAARALALARKKPDNPRAAARGAAGAWLDLRWMRGLAVAVPLLAMVIGLASVYQVEREQQAAELAELDAAMLSDELPLTAYTDHGFNAYLVQQQQAPRGVQ